MRNGTIISYAMGNSVLRQTAYANPLKQIFPTT